MAINFPTNSVIFQRLLLISTLIITFTSILSWWLISDSWGHYKHANNSLEQFEEFYHVLVVSNRLADERGFANELIFASPEESQQNLRHLSHSQLLTDKSFLDLPDRLKNGPVVVHARALLSKSRAVVQQCAFARCQSSQSIAKAINTMMTATNYYHKAVFQKTNDFIQKEPGALMGILRAQALGELRDLTGKLGSIMLLPLVEQRLLSNTELALITRRKVLIESQWKMLALRGDGTISSSLFTQHLLTTRHHYLNQGLSLVRYIESVSEEKEKYMLNMGDFASRYHNSLRTFNDLLNLYVSEITNSYLNKKNDALMHLILTALTLGIVYFLTLASMFYVQTRVLRPLWLLNKKARAITDGDEVSSDPPMPGSSEIQTLQETIATLGSNFDEQLAHSEHLKLRAEQDELTGLRNRRGFEAGAREILSHASVDRPAWLILLDIDFFKSINDTWGHPVGDEVLAKLGRQLAHTSHSGEVVARIGGEEFAIMLCEGDKQKVKARIREFQRACWRVRVEITPETIISITASFGASSAWQGSLVAMSAEADRALYTAKRNGRNRVAGLV